MTRRNAMQTLSAVTAPSVSIGEPRQRRILILCTRLTGVRYHAEPEIFDRPRPVNALAREPENPHSPDVTRADWRGRPIGYLPSDHNYAPARLLDAGERLEARIVELDIKQRSKWPVEVDMFLKFPVVISAGNAS